MARTEALHSATYELSYASINWIRFEGSPCRATVRASGLSAPCRGSPSSGAKVVRPRAGVNASRGRSGIRDR